MESIQPKAVAPADAARMIGVGRSKFWSLMAAGTIPYKRIGRRRVVEISAIDHFLNSLPSGESRAVA